MLTGRLPTIRPTRERDAALEVTRIHSASGRSTISTLQTAPPFRAPHHSASSVALVGGGSPRVRPGEITLAHRGALFLDELPEFPTSVLEGLRQPLEERVVRISRASGTLAFPADFLLVACANPCPCGRKALECRCGDAQRMRYARRLSAPLLDRFDLRLRIDAAGSEAGESSEETRARVCAAIERQRGRLGGTRWRRNAHIPAGALEVLVALPRDAHAAWDDACRLRLLTGRGAARVRRVARTFADLADRAAVTADDVMRAAWLREDVW